ncbi:MAG TPA: PEP-utilizing enzyme [Chloroflexota bacterium]|nr:PEP-utilizing enzyme [Chloroflexota bacterium]
MATRSTARLLFGVGASRGVARGAARRIRTFEEAMRLAPDEVLVAEALPASWVASLPPCRAVVASLGGVLANSAIVLRERGIPAVVGAADAFGQIADGDDLEVDGFLGVVRVR